jgi:uncharacterized protein (TIGR03083 family)
VTVPQAEQFHVILDPARVCAAYAQQRRRFASEVAALDAGALATPSRCTQWSAADVVRHCLDVDGWMEAIWSGAPLPFTSFDPRVTPDEFVQAARATPDREVVERYGPSAESMAADVGGSGPDRWGLTSLSPLGMVPWWLSALHVFWDSWVHERDALLPVGTDVPAEPDEVEAALTYVLLVTGTLIAEPTDAVVGGIRLTTGSEGPTVAEPVADRWAPDDRAKLIDALSGRGPLEPVLSGTEPDVAQRLGALARAFNS